MPQNAIVGGAITTLPKAMTIAAFTALAWYNALTLTVQLFVSFKRRRGLYFWTILIAAWGCVLHSLGFLLKFFRILPNQYVCIAIIEVGWYGMVTGQSLVLYSRLYLVVRDANKIRWVLYMIIFDAIAFHGLGTVFFLLANSTNAKLATKFAPYFLTIEKTIMTGFCIQEFIISGLYILETRRILRPRQAFLKDQTRKAMWHLIYVNAFIVLMDVALLGTEFTDQFDIQVSFKAAVYSVKLQLEFAILNQLMNLVHDNGGMSKNRGFNSWGQNKQSAQQHGNGSTVYLTEHSRSRSITDNNRYSWRNVYPSFNEPELAAKGKRNGSRVVRTTEITIEECECGGRGGVVDSPK